MFCDFTSIWGWTMDSLMSYLNIFRLRGGVMAPYPGFSLLTRSTDDRNGIFNPNQEASLVKLELKLFATRVLAK